MRRIGKGFSGVETPLFDTIIFNDSSQYIDGDICYSDPKVANLEQDKVAQALEIFKLKQRVKKLEKNRRSKRMHQNKGRMQEDVIAVKEVNAAEPIVFDDEEVTMTMAQTLIKMKEQMQEKHLDNIKKYQSLKRKPISVAQAKKNMIVYLKNMARYKIQYFKGMTYDQKDENEVWAMKMEYWITNSDMNIWNVIKNGNSLKRTGRADFHYMDDAREIWNAVKARFGGKAESKMMRKSMLRQEFLEFRIIKAKGVHKGFLRALPSSWFQVALTLKTKGGLEFLSFDDLCYKLKTLEMDIKGYNTFSLSQFASPSHTAFVSATSTNKKLSYGDSPNHSSTTTYSVPSNSKTGSHRTGNVIEDVLQLFVVDTKPEQQLAYKDLDHIEKLDVEEMDLKWQMALLSVIVHKFEQKAGRKIDFGKKESARFNKQKVRCYKCQQRGHFIKECRAKGDKQRYSTFKKQEIRRKEEDSKALVSVDTLVDWSNLKNESDEVIAATEFGMIVGANSKKANTPDDVGEFALMGVTSKKELGWDDSAFSVFTTNSKDVKGRPTFHSDKSLEDNTSDFASCDSSGKSSEHKPTDIDSNVGTPITKPISVKDLPSFTCNSSEKTDHTSRNSCDKRGPFNKKACHFKKHVSSVSKSCFVCGSCAHLIKDCDFYENQITNSTVGIGVGHTIRQQPVPAGNPMVKPVPTSQPKVNLVPTAKPKVRSVPTGKPQVTSLVLAGRPYSPFLVPTDKGYSPSVMSGWWSHTLSTTIFYLRKHNLYTITLNDLCPRVQTPVSGISILLAVGTTFTGSGNLYFQWELSPGSRNALCILFPTILP
nr:hypothetical protein [Tanacetum cinerariifolium]